ncbi:hypothetical protein EDB89DRAFT_1911768 [Lactarius sanguifluus]|nr:hypothetical protein EDB89DRAFT_1911768 [Lactarius sanguifluus]
MLRQRVGGAVHPRRGGMRAVVVERRVSDSGPYWGGVAVGGGGVLRAMSGWHGGWWWPWRYNYRAENVGSGGVLRAMSGHGGRWWPWKYNDRAENEIEGDDSRGVVAGGGVAGRRGLARCVGAAWCGLAVEVLRAVGVGCGLQGLARGVAVAWRVRKNSCDISKK